MRRRSWLVKTWLLLAALIGAWGGPRTQREFFAGPQGTALGTGTVDDPWDLATALRQPKEVRPGDEIWLLGGTYGSGSTYFTSTLTGTAAAPIVVRQYPGQHATISGSLQVHGAYTWYWDFEVSSPFQDRTGSTTDPASGMLDGIDVNGPFTKLINLVIHDTREGIGLWTPAAGAEVSGCIIFNNGWQGPDRGHGHGIYTQNRDDVKRLTGNVIFHQFGIGIHGYGSSQAFVRNYQVDHNVVFENGVLARDGASDNILFATQAGLSGIHVENNYTYFSGGTGSSRMGWSYGGNNADVAVLNNVFAGGYIALGLWNWQSTLLAGNTIFSSSIDLYTSSSTIGQAGSNRYFGGGQFYLDGARKDWLSWRASEGAGSTFTRGGPTGTWTFIVPNEFEEGRSTIVVYNWGRAHAITADLSAVLPLNANYSIWDAENFLSPPLYSGIYDGRGIRIPMAGLTVAAPSGQVPNQARHTAPEFGVFIVRRNDLAKHHRPQ